MALLRKRAGFEGESALGEALDEGSAAERIIACAACRHPLTRAATRLDKEGSHCHTCVNPAGVVFHIACFGAAPGAVAYGEPTAHFSWFAGYRWQMASCGGCTQHLGWCFRGEDVFWGLIRARLIEMP